MIFGHKKFLYFKGASCVFKVAKYLIANGEAASNYFGEKR